MHRISRYQLLPERLETYRFLATPLKINMKQRAALRHAVEALWNWKTSQQTANVNARKQTNRACKLAEAVRQSERHTVHLKF